MWIKTYTVNDEIEIWWVMMRIRLNNRPCGWSELPSACPQLLTLRQCLDHFAQASQNLSKSKDFLSLWHEHVCCLWHREVWEKPPAQHVWGTWCRTMCYIFKTDANTRFGKSGCEAWIWGVPKMWTPKSPKIGYNPRENQWFGVAIF